MFGTVPIASLLRRRRAVPDPLPVDLPRWLELSGGERLAVTVRRNARARRIILRLSPGSAGVTLTAPPRTSNRLIAEFLQRHRGWVEERAAKAPEPIAIADGAVIPFRGTTLTLRQMPAGRSTFLVPGEDGMQLLVGGRQEYFSRRVVDALKREARADLQAAVDRHAANLGVKPRSLAVKDTKSRWGSCSSDRRLAFSWRIVMAPPHVLDYLAAHEVAHLREMNHGPQFWALCRELCPEMDSGRAWLKRNGAGLHAISPG